MLVLSMQNLLQTPFDPNVKLKNHELLHYRTLVEKLLYLIITRPSRNCILPNRSCQCKGIPWRSYQWTDPLERNTCKSRENNSNNFSYLWELIKNNRLNLRGVTFFLHTPLLLNNIFNYFFQGSKKRALAPRRHLAATFRPLALKFGVEVDMARHGTLWR